MWGRRLRLLIKEGAPHARHFKISGFINSVREAKVETTSDHPSFHVWDRDSLCPLTGRVWDNRLKLFEALEMLIDESLVHLPKLVNDALILWVQLILWLSLRFWTSSIFGLKKDSAAEAARGDSLPGGTVLVAGVARRPPSCSCWRLLTSSGSPVESLPAL